MYHCKNVYRAILFCLVLSLSVNLSSQETIINSPPEVRTKKTIEEVGDILQIALPTTAGLVTVLSGDYDGSWQFLKSFSANLAVTYFLKFTIDKDRPAGATDGHAFPSGHTSSAFQGASFIQRRYGWKYGVPAYLLATFTAYSRVEGINKRHDVYDVIGGATLGILSSYLFTKPKKDNLDITFSSSKNFTGISLVLKF
ncbi:phosphatase PAP2 family protein [Aquimarina latercula]|uniref:phosphatase PAP2 family protein n=1 Tax=Aquimarina latercula TaxID=987 RepID=UPI00041AEEA9|nr:phosphatase PAP2 family protein [Aquimarina latercula]